MSYTNQTDSRYKFTEKERDLGTNYDYFGARYYDSELGRWHSVDPLADKYPGWSPYNYCLNNPLIVIDPNGADTLYFDQNGNYSRYNRGGMNIGHILDGKGNVVRSFSFLDPSDAKAIISTRDADGNLLPEDQWTPNGDGFKISGLDLSFESSLAMKVYNGVAPAISMVGPGANLAKLAYVAKESFPNGDMDYVSHFNGVLNNKLAVIGGMAYNNFDAGNYMWGMGMSLLGHSPAAAQQAARIYENLRNNRPDQVYDQTAIWNGAMYINKRK